jgi:hypothetical protein
MALFQLFIYGENQVQPEISLVLRELPSLRPASLFRSSLAETVIHQLYHLAPKRIILSELCSVFLSNDLVVREKIKEVEGDEGLRREIRDCRGASDRWLAGVALRSGVSDTHQSLDSCLASQQSHPPSD